jgi:hypothetical protein
VDNGSGAGNAAPKILRYPMRLIFALTTLFALAACDVPLIPLI